MTTAPRRPKPVVPDLDWMGTTEAARYLGMSNRTLYRQIDEAQIPAFRFGRVIRIQKADLDRYIEASRIAPGELDHLYPETAAQLAGGKDF